MAELFVLGDIKVIKYRSGSNDPDVKSWTPNPFSELVSNCFSSLSLALPGVNIQSSSLKV